jgi:hypothetical protein
MDPAEFSSPPRIVIAESDAADAFEEEVGQIVEALLGHRQALVTDYSDIGDFCPGPAELEALAAMVGRPVKPGDRLVTLAIELRVRQSQQNLR